MTDARLNEARAERPYHHGNLRKTLIDAARVLLESGGAEALTTRACAKASGVAPSAVFRHFPDKRALATALAAIGYREMVAEIESRRAQAQTAGGRFAAVGEGYLAYALTHPHLFRLMFHAASLDLSDPEFSAATDALGALTVGDLDDMTQGNHAASRDGGTTLGGDKGVLAWALVHGLATLALDSQLDARLPTDPAERFAVLRRVMGRIAPALREES